MRLSNDLQKIKGRKTKIDGLVTKSVEEILTAVKVEGDSAVKRYAKKFDGFEGDFLVSSDEIKDAVNEVGADFVRILERAKQQITEFHTNQIGKSWETVKENGVVTGQFLRPLERVALYIPGGTAAYPSTVLMSAIPAKLAGVSDIVIFTPVKADGKVPAFVLAAAFVCGVSRIYKIGGVQAVAAAAYGTQSISKVNKIVGPGNAFVATAKRLVYGEVDIDMVAGPSEILIIADEKANPKYIAADLLSQAEHDELASSVLITTSKRIIEETEKEIDRQLEYLNRKETIRKSLENYGAAILVKNLEEAFEISNSVAPEHLEILTDAPFEKLPLVKNAGSVFLGENTPEPLGDYMSGTNHILPTNGSAKFYSPLGVYDFVKFSSYSYYPHSVLKQFKDDIIKFAAAEGLDAHANSIKVRFEK